ncbi:MAG: cell division protein FtsZ, partial [Oscillospiraceae bacterium]|nr:cell division protein FtsZ [Oscillospiraceae bacterium]
LITNTGFINLDFADVACIMRGAGLAHMGVGYAIGKGKAEEAAKMAVSSPLLETSINGARGVLINITGSDDMGLEDVEAAANLVQEAAHPDANIIFGTTFDNSMEDQIRVTVIATGFEEPAVEKLAAPVAEAKPVASSGLFSAAAAQREAEPVAAPAAPVSNGSEDPFDSIFKIFNTK